MGKPAYYRPERPREGCGLQLNQVLDAVVQEATVTL